MKEEKMEKSTVAINEDTYKGVNMLKAEPEKKEKTKKGFFKKLIEK